MFSWVGNVFWNQRNRFRVGYAAVEGADNGFESLHCVRFDQEMVGPGRIALLDIALYAGTAEDHDWCYGIFVHQAKPMEEVATRATAAQFVIQKNECRIWLWVSRAAPCLEILDG